MHLVLAVYASPKKLREWEDFINNKLRYPWNGPLREGFHQPFLSRLPFGLYDIRIKKEIAPLLLRDLGAIHPEDFSNSYKMKKWRRNRPAITKRGLFLRFALWSIRTALGLHLTQKAEGTQGGIVLGGWMKVLYIGSLDDKLRDGQECL